MTKYPYSFYVVGHDNIKQAVDWCDDKYKGTDFIVTTSMKFNVDQITPRWLEVAKFSFFDCKTAFEFALVWN